MIVKALLAWAGLRAVPDLHNQAVHDVLNVKAALLAGHARLVRLQGAADIAAASGDADLVAAVAHQQSEVRTALDELAGRLS